MNINNLERLKMDIEGIDIDDKKLSIYLAENGLQATAQYNTDDTSNLKGIYATALSVLEGLANNPRLLNLMIWRSVSSVTT